LATHHRLVLQTERSGHSAAEEITMKTKAVRGATQEPLDEDERTLMDPETWDWENPIEGRTVGTPGAVVRVRFSREEFSALERIAKNAGMGPVELIRQTMLGRIATEDFR
jgi:hypothetical protein